MVTEVPWAWWQHRQHSTWESCTHGQILKGVGGSGKSHLNLPQENGLSTPVLATAESNCFSFPKQAENIRFNGSFLCWKCSQAINFCRFLQSFTFHGRFSTRALLPAVVC